MQKLYDFARGTVRLNIAGAQPERMLNALAMAGIMFWDCDPADGCTVKATIYSDEYEKTAWTLRASTNPATGWETI